MKYIVVSEPRGYRSGDTFASEFENLDEAKSEARYQWSHSTNSERKKHTVYVLVSENPDVDSENHYDGNYAWIDGEEQ